MIVMTSASVQWHARLKCWASAFEPARLHIRSLAHRLGQNDEGDALPSLQFSSQEEGRRFLSRFGISGEQQMGGKAKMCRAKVGSDSKVHSAIPRDILYPPSCLELRLAGLLLPPQTSPGSPHRIL